MSKKKKLALEDKLVDKHKNLAKVAMRLLFVAVSIACILVAGFVNFFYTIYQYSQGVDMIGYSVFMLVLLFAMAYVLNKHGDKVIENGDALMKEINRIEKDIEGIK